MLINCNDRMIVPRGRAQSNQPVDKRPPYWPVARSDDDAAKHDNEPL